MKKEVLVNEEYTPNGGVMISEMNLEGIITFANRNFCEATGYEFNEIIGKSYSIVKHPDMPDTLYKKMWQILRDSQAWSAVVKNIRKNGHYYWIETEIMPIHGEDKKIKGYIGSSRAASRKNIQEAEKLYEKMLKS